jgi:hypothetical protein
MLHPQLIFFLQETLLVVSATVYFTDGLTGTAKNSHYVRGFIMNF